MKKKLICVAGLLVTFCFCGCSNTSGVSAGSPPPILSPLAGKWEGKSDVKGGDLAKALNGLAGGPLTGHSTLTLNSDGTGFLKVADKPERPISWKQEGEKVVISTREAGATSDSAGKDTWVGTLSGDKKSMTIDMEDVKVTLSKQ